MLRLCLRSASGSARAWRTRHGAVRQFADLPEEFKTDFRKVAPNLDLPSTPSTFLKERPPVPSSIPDKVTLNFTLPHESPYFAKEVDSVIVPASSGQMGVLPGHVPTIAELKAGPLSIAEEGGGGDAKFFVSGGFAFVHENSVLDVVAVEAVPLDRLDPEEVKKGLAHFTTALASANSDLERAEAQIGVEVHSAMSAALGL